MPDLLVRSFTPLLHCPSALLYPAQPPSGLWPVPGFCAPAAGLLRASSSRLNWASVS